MVFRQASSTTSSFKFIFLPFLLSGVRRAALLKNKQNTRKSALFFFLFRSSYDSNAAFANSAEPPQPPTVFCSGYCLFAP